MDRRTFRKISARSGASPVDSAAGRHGSSPTRKRRRIALVSLLAALTIGLTLVPDASAEIAGTNVAFVITCKPSHQNADDPIMFPGQPGASHLHQFFGARTTDAFSTTSSLQSGDTTCRADGDTAAAWIPTVYYNGEPTVPRVMGVYYMSRKFAKVLPPPIGMQLVIGNGNVAGDGKQQVFWTCSDGDKSFEPIDCTGRGSGHTVTLVVRMPNCWDGMGLTTEHFAYSGGTGIATGTQATCPAGFPTPIAQIEEHVRLTYPDGADMVNPYNADGSLAVSFSSGEASTAHGDYFNSWVASKLQAFIDGCVNEIAPCPVS